MSYREPLYPVSYVYGLLLLEPLGIICIGSSAVMRPMLLCHNQMPRFVRLMASQKFLFFFSESAGTAHLRQDRRVAGKGRPPPLRERHIVVAKPEIDGSLAANASFCALWYEIAHDATSF